MPTTAYVEGLRKDIEEWWKCWTYQVVENWGWKKPLHLDECWGYIRGYIDDYPTVVSNVNAAINRETNGERKTLEKLSRVFIMAVINDLLGSFSEKITTIKDGYKTHIGRKEYGINDLYGLAYSDDKELRKKKEDAFLPLQEKLEPVFRERTTALNNIAKQSGYKDLLSYENHEFEIELFLIKENAQKILDSTRSVYESLLLQFLEETLGISRLDEFYQHDIGYFRKKFGTHEEDFPKEKALNICKDTLRMMGINMEKRKGVTIDDEDRKEKRWGVMCFDKNNPDDIIIFIRQPSGGYQYYYSILHEYGGHVNYHSAISPSLPFESRYKLIARDGILDEGIARTMDSIRENKLWLSEVMKLDDEKIERLMKENLFWDIGGLRYYSALGIFEIEALKDGLTTKELTKRFAKSLKQATLAQIRPEWKGYATKYEGDIIINPYYLLAEMFSAQTRGWLRESHGTRKHNGLDWFRNPETGKWLEEVFSLGFSVGADEILQRYGIAKKISPEPLLREIKERCEILI